MDGPVLLFQGLAVIPVVVSILSLTLTALSFLHLFKIHFKAHFLHNCADSVHYSCLKVSAPSILTTAQGGYYYDYCLYSNMGRLGHRGF